MLVKFGIPWIDEILPKGFPANTSTLVSGPGGSGKPLVGYIFASGWLKNGGNVAFLLTRVPQKHDETPRGKPRRLLLQGLLHRARSNNRGPREGLGRTHQSELRKA